MVSTSAQACPFPDEGLLASGLLEDRLDTERRRLHLAREALDAVGALRDELPESSILDLVTAELAKVVLVHEGRVDVASKSVSDLALARGVA